MIDFDEYLKNKMKDKHWKKGFDKEYEKIEEKDDLKNLLKEIQEMPIEQLTKELKDEIEGISDVRDFMVEVYERLKLGTITKDEFLEHLFRLAKLDEFNSFDAKNVK